MLRARQSERSEAPRSARCKRDEETDADEEEAGTDDDAAAGGEEVSKLVDRLSDAMQSGGDAASD